MTLRIELSNYGNSNFQRIIGHNNDFLDSWNHLDNTLFSKSTLEPELIEQVRRTLAFINKCEYCMVKAGRPDTDNITKRISIATAFADYFGKDHFTMKELNL
jgi:alkylhydroperoxidase family enzyme